MNGDRLSNVQHVDDAAFARMKKKADQKSKILRNLSQNHQSGMIEFTHGFDNWLLEDELDHGTSSESDMDWDEVHSSDTDMAESESDLFSGLPSGFPGSKGDSLGGPRAKDQGVFGKGAGHGRNYKIIRKLRYNPATSFREELRQVKMIDASMREAPYGTFTDAGAADKRNNQRSEEFLTYLFEDRSAIGWQDPLEPDTHSHHQSGKNLLQWDWDELNRPRKEDFDFFPMQDWVAKGRAFVQERDEFLELFGSELQKQFPSESDQQLKALEDAKRAKERTRKIASAVNSRIEIDPSCH